MHLALDAGKSEILIGACEGEKLTGQYRFRGLLLDFFTIDSLKELLGTNSAGSVRYGLYARIIGMIDGNVERLFHEINPESKTDATGANSSLIVAGSRYLTLEGSRRFWERNH